MHVCLQGALTGLLSFAQPTDHFTAALLVLSVPVMNVETSPSDLTYNDNLIYHYSSK